MTGLTLLLAAALHAPLCPPLTPAALKDLARAKGGAVDLVFFASWCAGCKEHLTAHHDRPTLLIGSFDKPNRLAEVIEALKPDAPCYSDAGIADAMDVQALPSVRHYKSP